MNGAIQFPPALMSREMAAYYATNGSLRDLDRLRETKVITPLGDGRRVMYRKSELDAYIETLPERDASRGQSA